MSELKKGGESCAESTWRGGTLQKLYRRQLIAAQALLAPTNRRKGRAHTLVAVRAPRSRVFALHTQRRWLAPPSQPAASNGGCLRGCCSSLSGAGRVRGAGAGVRGAGLESTHRNPAPGGAAGLSGCAHFACCHALPPWTAPLTHALCASVQAKTSLGWRKRARARPAPLRSQSCRCACSLARCAPSCVSRLAPAPLPGAARQAAAFLRAGVVAHARACAADIRAGTSRRDGGCSFVGPLGRS